MYRLLQKVSRSFICVRSCTTEFRVLGLPRSRYQSAFRCDSRRTTWWWSLRWGLVESRHDALCEIQLSCRSIDVKQSESFTAYASPRRPFGNRWSWSYRPDWTPQSTYYTGRDRWPIFRTSQVILSRIHKLNIHPSTFSSVFMFIKDASDLKSKITGSPPDGRKYMRQTYWTPCRVSVGVSLSTYFSQAIFAI